MEDHNYLVCVSCSTYNQAPFIEDVLNGFCMQKTTFPFVCTIVDDFSTDGEPEVIRNYLHEHFDLEDNTILRNGETNDHIFTFARHKENLNCFFAVVFLKYNHYSIRKSKLPYVEEWRSKCKYIALCEGDDYWIDAEKLQKQVSFLESHKDYVMACNRTYLYSVRKQKIVGESFCYDCSRDMDPVDVIRRGGLFISTCSIVFKRKVIENIPDYWKKCGVGDYPLQIACVLHGKAYYFNELMSVYRIDNPTSWVGRQQFYSVTEKRLAMIKSEVEMLRGFAKDFPNFESVFFSRIAHFINRNIPSWIAPRNNSNIYVNYFKEYIDEYNLRWRMDYWFCIIRIPIIRKLYSRLFTSGYYPRKVMY